MIVHRSSYTLIAHREMAKEFHGDVRGKSGGKGEAGSGGRLRGLLK